MTIPETPFSECDCCGYGFELFVAEQLLDWYLSRGHTDPTSDIEKIEQASGASLATPAWNDAQFARAVGRLSGVDYFYVYIANAGTGNPPHIKKYDINGNLSWDYTATGMLHFQFAGAGTSNYNRVAVDNDGYSYITGTTNDAILANRKTIVQKVNPSGSQVWSTTLNNPGSSTGGVGITVDRSGNVGITGGAIGAYLNSSGVEQWKLIIGNGFKVAFDSSGNVYFLRQVTSAPFATEVRTYTSAGSLRFTKSGTWGDMEIFSSRLYGSSVDTTNKKVILSRYSGSSLGTTDWEVQISYTESQLLNLNIGVDGRGNLYASWTAFTSPNRFSYFTRRAAASGAEHYSGTSGVALNLPLIPPGRPPNFF